MSMFQKALLAASSSVMGLLNPLNGDMIATLGETLPLTETVLQKRILARMMQSESGREILSRRPIVHEGLLDMDALRALPENTLGHAYWQYMHQNNFLASERTPVRYIDNPELVYVMRRYREIHDFVHVVCGLASPHVLHELAVKWFEFAQTHLPMCGISGLGGTLFSCHLSRDERRVLVQHLLPWALKQGSECEFLMNVPFETMLERDIDELRRDLRLDKAPDIHKLLLHTGETHNVQWA